jgi:CheY-like chemotaxis protein
MMEDINQIVIIDDNKIDCFINQKICSLAFEKTMIKTFKSSVLALEYFKEPAKMKEPFPVNSVDVILLDINMPVMNGFEFLKKLAETDFFKKNPVDVYFLSSSNNEKDIYEALSIEFCSGYIMKPLTKHKLIEAMKSKHKKEYFLLNYGTSTETDKTKGVA